MDRERYEKIASLFARALELSPDDRDAFVEEAAEGDADLRERVRELLDADAAAGRWSRVASGAGNESDACGSASPPETGLPSRIGSFDIVGVRGRGGMGIVYEARQDTPSRVVALKVMLAALSERQRWRFEYEAEMLARVRHPCVAKVFEVGTFEGPLGTQPYIAMELIDGVPIDVHCLERNLDSDERIELLAEVAEGVHHAHLAGVVHRDLKPANILVEPEGRPRIVDFGVARGVGDARETGMRTMTGELVGTLAYMSPEQVKGDPGEVGPASDVYALGVIAYELLANRLPHPVDSSSFGDAVRAIVETPPSRLGAVDPRYRGDVETIVGKALSKDPSRRYASAAEFAEDLRRYLNDEPIVARPASGWYHLARFARRHRALTASAASVLLLIIAALAIVSSYSVRAKRSERQALDRLQEAEAIAGFLEDTLEAGWRREGRPDLTVREVLDQAAGNIDREFEGRPLVKARILHTIGTSYKALTLFERAEPFLLSALELRERHLGRRHPLTVESIAALGSFYWTLNRRDEAEALLREALPLVEENQGEDAPQATGILLDLANIMDDDPHRLDEAASLYEEIESRFERSGGFGSESGITFLSNYAVLLRRAGRVEEAERRLRRAVETGDAALSPHSRPVLGARVNLGSVLLRRHRPEEASRVLRRAYEDSLAALGEEHLTTVMAAARLSRALLDLGDAEEALPLMRFSLEGQRRSWGNDHPRTLIGENELARIQLALGRFDESLQLADSIVGRWAASGDPDPSNLGFFLETRARALEGLGRVEESEAALGEALAVFERETGEDGADARRVKDRMLALRSDGP